jgi:hypothetical protein
MVDSPTLISKKHKQTMAKKKKAAPKKHKAAKKHK